MGWLIALAVLVFLGQIPVGISLRYGEKKFGMKLKILCASFSLPVGKKDKKPEKTPESRKKGSAEDSSETQKDRQPEPVSEKKQARIQKKEAEQQAEALEKELADRQKKPQEHSEGLPQKIKSFLPFIRVGIDFLKSLRRKLRIEKLCFKVTLAGQDPCDLAVNYGRTWAGASALMSNLNEIFVIRDQDLDIQCDFAAEKTVISGRADLTLTIGRILGLAVVYGFRVLKEFIIFKKRKGGAAL